jgi:transposase
MSKQKVSKTTRREFTKEFKLDAVNLVRRQGMKCADIARDLGINSNLLSRWLRESEGLKPAKAFPGKGNNPESDEKMRELEKQVRKLTMERDILKKAMAFFVELPK